MREIKRNLTISSPFQTTVTMLRRLPPTASPLSVATLARATNASPGAQEAFRRALRAYLGTREVFLASSGRTALYLLFEALKSYADGGQRQVIMPAYTCPSLVKVVDESGLIPIFVDISPRTLVMQEEALAREVGREALAIIVVHPFAIPHPLDHPQALAREFGAALIEDAAQALGARAGGRPVGVRGNFGLFSLGPGKPISTGGGGIVCTSDEERTQWLAQAWDALPPTSRKESILAAARLGAMSAAFQPRGWWLATRLGLHKIGDQEESWGFQLTGLTDAQAAVGCEQLARLDEITARRRSNAARLMQLVAEVDFAHVPLPDSLEEEHAEPGFLRLPLILDSEKRRDALFQALWDAGIGAGKLYKRTLAEFFPQYALTDYPGAHAVSRRLLTLPTHHYLREADFERIEAALKKVGGVAESAKAPTTNSGRA